MIETLPRLDYYFAWKNNAMRASLYKKPCRVLARGSMNTILIEFANGFQMTTSRNAVRKIK